MYLVDFKSFNDFITKKGFTIDPLTVAPPVGSILEYRRDGVMYAKVEMYNFNEFNFLRKNAKTLSAKPSISRRSKRSKSQNCKFWIRGEEWKVIDNQQVKELVY